MSWVIYDFSHMFICLLWFCHGLPKGEIVRTYVVVQDCEHMSLFYVIGLSLDKTHFTCNWVDLGCVKHFKKQWFKIKCWSRQSLSKKQARKCKILKLDTYLDRYIYRDLKKLFSPSLDSCLDTSRHLYLSRIKENRIPSLFQVQSVCVSLGLLFS